MIISNRKFKFISEVRLQMYLVLNETNETGRGGI